MTSIPSFLFVALLAPLWPGSAFASDVLTLERAMELAQSTRIWSTSAAGDVVTSQVALALARAQLRRSIGRAQ
jgi:hypothetical protein